MADFIDRGEAMMNDPATVERIRRMSIATGYHPTYIAAWMDVESAETPDERANRAAMMSRTSGDSFSQYADNSQRQWETKKQMRNSRKNREHQTLEREAGEEFRSSENQKQRDFDSNEAALRRNHENEDREARIKANRKQSNRDHRKTKKENDRQNAIKEDQADTRYEREKELEGIHHQNQVDLINLKQSADTDTNAGIAARERDALLAEEPSYRRYQQLVIDARSILGNDASIEEVNDFLRKDMADTYFNFFHDPESPIAASGHVPPGLSAEMKEVLGEMSFEEFADYVELDADDSRTAQWYTEITGREPERDHFLW